MNERAKERQNVIGKSKVFLMLAALSPDIAPILSHSSYSLIMGFTRRFPLEPKSLAEIEGMSQRDFVDYLREQLWDKKAQELYHKNFDSLTDIEKSDADLHVILDIAKVFIELLTKIAGRTKKDGK